jgi:hypothetical protein
MLEVTPQRRGAVLAFVLVLAGCSTDDATSNSGGASGTEAAGGSAGASVSGGSGGASETDAAGDSAGGLPPDTGASDRNVSDLSRVDVRGADSSASDGRITDVNLIDANATDSSTSDGTASDVAVDESGSADNSVSDGTASDGSLVDGSDTDASPSCLPSGACANGPQCGAACCGQREWCDTSGGSPQCRCGTQAACATGSSCVSNLPFAECGFSCCPPLCPP